MRNIPVFEKPLEIKIALNMAGRVLKLESASRITDKMNAARDLKTYITSFKHARHDYDFSDEFKAYTEALTGEAKSILRENLGEIQTRLSSPKINESGFDFN